MLEVNLKQMICNEIIRSTRFFVCSIWYKYNCYILLIKPNHSPILSHTRRQHPGTNRGPAVCVWHVLFYRSEIRGVFL